MRRFPFYAYPHSFYSSPAQAPYHRTSPLAPSPAPTTRSVINVPVFDSIPSRRSSCPPQSQPPTSPATSPPLPLIDPSSAATIIQSHFRGFRVRRHRPLLHLRSIAKARKQLDDLQSELERPEFILKVRTSEKERLRFSENVMAIILRLDAIEGSMAEVRSQRKEATKMAIKLQDALDAVMMQKDGIAALSPTADDGGVPPDKGFVLLKESLEPLYPDISMVQGEVYTDPEESTMGVAAMQENPTSPEHDVADKYMSNLDKGDAMETEAKDLSLLPPEDENGEAGSSCFEMIPQVQPAKTMHDAEQDVSTVTGENAGSDEIDRAEEEVNKGIDDLYLHAHKNDVDNDASVTKMYQDIHVDDMIIASHDSAESEYSNHTCMDTAQEEKEGLSQDVELCQGTPAAEEKCGHHHHSNAVCQSQIQGPSTASGRLTEGKCYSDIKGSVTPYRHGYEACSNGETHENCSNSCYEVQLQASNLSMEATPSSDNNAILQRLSEDCRQLKSLVGKLLAQNKAQSKVLCALSDRLELLEHQQQCSCQHNQQKMREKRKSKKELKRSVIKCRNCE